MSALTQDTRIAELKTPLGKDILVLAKFDGTEGVSELFEFKISAVSNTKGLNFDDAIGKNCTLKVKTIGHGDRFFVGTLADGHAADESVSAADQIYGYELTLRPWLWLLSRQTNSQIFNNEAVDDIISKIFKPYGSPAEFEFKLEKKPEPIEYCVQHRETDLDFVCRLMELYGFTYHYEFTDGHQKLVIGDGMSAYPPVDKASREYNPVQDDQNRTDEHLYSWVPKRALTTGKSTLNSYDFKKPSSKLVEEVAGDAKYDQGELEQYDHPANYVKPDDGKAFSTVVKNAARSGDNHFVAEGDGISLSAGHLMTLTKHPTGSQNVEYLVLRCTHELKEEVFRSGNGAGGYSDFYRGSYEFVKSSVPYAPPIVTPRPLISGPQTAKVVGKGEIDVDEHGRILVQFHWDRKTKQSMRCRVAQSWAGPSWGTVFIPRIGMEVLVQFLDGDPDRPIIVGCVYNGDNMPPYKLADKKNITGWKTNSTEGGGGYNEFVMDDTKGKELVRAHAQKDLDSTVEHDETHLIKNDRTTTIQHDDTTTVTHDIMIEAKHQITLKVGTSTIVMDQTSITITSTNVTIDAKAQFQSSAKAISQHTSSGPFTINGAIVMIN